MRVHALSHRLGIVFLLVIFLFPCLPANLMAKAAGPINFKIAAVTLDSSSRQNIYVAFSRNIHNPTRPVAVYRAVEISPRLQGIWSWVTPSLLRFRTSNPLPEAAQYKLRFIGDKLAGSDFKLTGNTVFTLKTRTFQVESLKLWQEPKFKNGQAMSVICGKFKFNRRVNPKNLLANLSLDDPLQSKPVQILMRGTYPYSTLEFESEPVPRLRKKRSLKLILSSRLSANRSNLTLDAGLKRSIPIVFDPNLRLENINREIRADGGLIQLSFSSPISENQAQLGIATEPKVRFKAERKGLNLVLSGDFKPGHEYELILNKGLTAMDGAVFPKSLRSRVVFPNLNPWVDFAHDGLFLPRQGMQTLALKAMNTPQVKINVDRVFPNNLFFLFADYGYETFRKSYYQDSLYHTLGGRIAEKTLNLPHELNKQAVFPLDLKQYIPENTPGFYRIGAIMPGDYEGVQRWALVTDLGVVAKQGQDDFMVWVSSLSDLSAQDQVKITVLSDQNQIIAKGQTNERGLWHAHNLEQILKKNRPFMVLAQKGEDTSFVLLNNFKIDTTGLDVSGASYASGAYTAYIYGERDLYRPGEKVNGMLLLRESDLGIAPDMPVRLRCIDPQGRELGTRLLHIKEQGGADFNWELPAFALTGRYNLQALVGQDVVGQYQFQVEQFVPDRIKVKISSPESKQLITLKDKIKFEVSSNYLFGPPAAGMKATTRVRLDQAVFQPKGYENYIFGSKDIKFKSKQIFSDSRILNKQGQAGYAVSIPEGLRPPAALQARISCNVQESGGRGVTSYLSLPVHVYAYYPGLLRLPKQDYSSQEEVKAKFVVLNPQGQKTEAALRLDIFKDEWQTVLRRNPSGSYRYESICNPRLLESRQIQAKSGEGSFSYVPQEFGSYRFMLSDERNKGAVVEQSFYVSGWGYSPWAISNPARLELVPDKKAYLAGEQAKIQIRAPFSGKLLVTLEGRDTYEVQVHELKQNTGEVVLPLKKEYAPNVYVTATLVRPAHALQPGEVARAFGALPIFVDRETNRQRIALDIPQEMRPEHELNVKLKTEPRSLVSISIVDEGIIQLAGSKPANPFDYFYARKKLAVTSFDTFSFLYPNVSKLFGKSSPGGGLGLKGRSQFLRTQGMRREKSIAYWSGPLLTDEKGEVELHWLVPQFQGALRITAVSANGRRFGSKSELTRVSSPLVLMPTFPRFIGLEEDIKLPVAVLNRTGQDINCTVQARSRGQIEFNASHDLNIKKDQEQTVYFDLSSGRQEGLAKINLGVNSTKDTTQAFFELPIVSRLPFVTDVENGQLDKCKFQLGLGKDRKLLPQTISRQLSIGSSPWVNYRGKLKSLLTYPYGCAEQTVSRAFPLLYFDNLALQLVPAVFTDNSVRFMVRSALERVRNMQTHDGGFAFWPGGKQAQAWVSIYVTHFLVQAEQTGYAIDSFFLNKALGYVRIQAKAQSAKPEILQRSCYALYVLALAGKGDLGSMDYLRANLMPDIPVDGRYLLAAAYHLLGQSSDLLKMLGSAQNSRQTYNLGSSLRSQAIQLLCLQDIAPADGRIPILAQTVGAQLSSRQVSTQDMAFAFLALGRLFAAGQKSPVSGQITVGGQKFADFAGSTPHVLELPAAGRVEIMQDKPCGKVYYQAQVRGVPTVKSWQAEQNGIKIQTRLLNRSGEPAEINNLKQGQTLILQTEVQSLAGRLENCVVQIPLPSCLEIDNPRLGQDEVLPWMKNRMLHPDYQDIRNDRILLFADLPARGKVLAYTQLRAVFLGQCLLPPAQVEAMYQPWLKASTGIEKMRVGR